MNGKTLIRKHAPGFSIVELVLVLVILTTLMSIATLNFNQWQRKYKVESQVKEMVTDFSELRVRAMTRKQRHSITVNRDNYVLKSYSSDDEDITAGTVIPPATRPVVFPLKSNSTTYYNGTIIFEIDHRGLLVRPVDTVDRIFLDDNDSGASINCLTLLTVRINPGKRNSDWSNCDDK